MTDFELTIGQEAAPFASTNPLALNLEVDVVTALGVRITDIPRRRGVACAEPLNVPGTGQISVQMDDPILKAYPTALNYGNIVRFWLGGKCISGFRIKSRTRTLVSSDEGAALVRTVSGPTVHHLLDDFLVKHARTPRPDSPSEREFTWASPAGDWYNASKWNYPVRQWTRKNPPTNAKKHMPKAWPVPSAKWIGFRGAHKYFRKDFTTSTDNLLVRIYATTDEWFKVYMDGELVLEGNAIETGYREFTYVDLVLPRGTHTVAAYARAIGSAGGDGWDNFIFGMCKITPLGKRILPPILVSNSTWKAHRGNPPPGWNRAQVLRQIIAEAKVRNVTAADLLVLGFGSTTDTAGQAWVDTFNESVSIGTSALDLQSQLSEGNGFDVWVDPADFTIKAWKQRGSDKSSSIALIPGTNLLDYEVEGTDEVVNDLLIQYEGGWTNASHTVSQSTYGKREGFISLGGITDASSASNLGSGLLRGLAAAQRKAGTADIKSARTDQPTGSILAVEGMVPMLDYETGDIIMAPNEDFTMKKHRVLSLSLQEDDNKALTWDAELEELV